jgi:hypothetical protein
MVLLYGVAAIAPVTIASLLTTRPPIVRSVTQTSWFEALLTAQVLFIMGLATVAAAVTIIQPLALRRNLWVIGFVVILVLSATLLSLARLWLHGTKQMVMEPSAPIPD